MLDHEADAIRPENATETPTIELNAETTVNQEIAEDATTTTRTPETMESIIARLKELAENDDTEISTDEISRIKQHFYHLRNENARLAMDTISTSEEDSTPADADPFENEFKSLMTQIKEKKAAHRARIEAEQLANL